MSEDYPGQAYVHKHNANIKRAEENAMSEQRAARGEGLAGAIDGALKEASVFCLACAKGEKVVVPPRSSIVGKAAVHSSGMICVPGTVRALIEERITALEAAAPASTPDVLREIAHIAGAPEGALPSLWADTRRERLDQIAEIARAALATPSPQAPAEQCKVFSTTSAREQSSATASVPLRHGVNCEKKPHVRDGYLHSEEDDTPYDVDGVKYCGRCHIWLDAPAAAQSHAEYFTDMIAGQAALDAATQEQPAGSGASENDLWLELARILRFEKGDEDGDWFVPAEPQPLGPFFSILQAATAFMRHIDATDKAMREEIEQLRGSPRKVGEDAGGKNE